MYSQIAFLNELSRLLAAHDIWVKDRAISFAMKNKGVLEGSAYIESEIYRLVSSDWAWHLIGFSYMKTLNSILTIRVCSTRLSVAQYSVTIGLYLFIIAHIVLEKQCCEGLN